VPPTAAEWAVFYSLFMHRGRENPLPLALIAIRNNLSQRGVKKAVEGLCVRHRVRIGSARGGRGLPVGYYLIESLEDRDAAARPYLRQINKMARRARAIFGDDFEFKRWLGQLQLELEQERLANDWQG
jgi:hypothetical protein